MTAEIVLLDLANVVTAAIVSPNAEAPPSRIVDLARRGEIVTLFSSESIDECREVLCRERVRRRH